MSVAGNVAAARERIAAACARAGRDVAEVRIVAASKMQPATAIVEAIAAGVDVVGENRVQEAAVKRPLVGGGPPWHLIGPLQRNKAKVALELFDAIETVDRAELADRMELLLAPTGRVVPVYIEVNIGGEVQKNGVMPDAAAPLADHLVSRCPHLALRGLMTVPPWHPDPARAGPHFAGRGYLGARLAQRGGITRMQLSMGMSEDFEIAVEEGATAVRLGRILFGERVTAR